MKTLILDGTGWQTRELVYDAFFRAVGAPEWHGRLLATSGELPSVNRRILSR
jgi:hypothetical protein